MAQKGLLSGPKFNGRHSTYNTLAAEVIARVKPLDAVRKIVLGPIKQVRPAERRVSVREDQGQVKVQCRDVGSVQILWVIGADAAVIRSAVEGLGAD